MADTRELIMARLAVLLRMPGVEVLRNQVVLDDEDDKTKRIVILEGDEIPSDEEQPKRRVPTSPRIIHMQPQILLSNFASSGDVGTGLAAMRASIIEKIATDATLIALTYDGSGGRYMGMSSDLAFARAMAGETALKFQFTYVLRPDEL